MYDEGKGEVIPPAIKCEEDLSHTAVASHQFLGLA
jgi:hypothetical protein